MTHWRRIKLASAVGLLLPVCLQAGPDPVVLRLDGVDIHQSQIASRSQKEDPGVAPSPWFGLGRVSGKVELVIFERGVGDLGIVASEEEVRARVQVMRPGLAEDPAGLLKRERAGGATLVRALRMACKEPANQERIYRDLVRDSTDYSYETWQAALRTFPTEERIAAMEAAVPTTVEDIYRAAYPVAKRWVLREKLTDRLTRETGVAEISEAAVLSRVRAWFGDTYTADTLTPTLRERARELLVEEARRNAYAKWLQRKFNEAKLDVVDPRLHDAVRALRSYWWKE